MARNVAEVEETVFVSVEVVKSKFYDAMVAIEDVPGAVGAGIDKNRVAKRNGHADKALPERARRASLPALLLAILKSGPKKASELRDTARRENFSPTSVSPSLNTLRRNEIVQTDGGVWSLTDKARADMAKPVQIVEPKGADRAHVIAALPAPPTPNRTGPATSLMLLHYMQKVDRPVKRSELKALISANRKEPSGVDAALTKLRNDKLIKAKEEGVSVLTALGRKYKTGDLQYITPAE